MIGLVFTENKVDSVGEGKDGGVILENISVISELVKAEENFVFFEASQAYVTGVISNVDVCMGIVVLGVIEDNKVENDLTVVEVPEETATGNKAESWTNVEDISDTGLEVTIEGLFKQSGGAVLEDLVISIVGVSDIILEVKEVTLTGSEYIW